MTTLVGLVANPLAGRDIRRITARASLVPNYEKSAVVRRLLAGLDAAGVEAVLYLPDLAGVVRAALDGAHLPLAVDPLAMRPTGRAEDSTRAARLLVRAGAAVIVTLGGDGTNRAVAAGCGDVPLVAVSTGTNNVFPTMVDGTVAGLAAGLVATGRVAGEAVVRRTKRVEVAGDFGLVDAASCRDRFVGSRAIWDPQSVRALVLARAEPWNVGLSSIGGAVCPVTGDEPGGLYVELGDGPAIRVPVAPGLVLPVPVRRWRRLDLDEPVLLGDGSGTIALDGEREFAVEGPAAARVTRTGPRLVDIRKALQTGSGDA